MKSKLIALFDIAQKDIYDKNSDLRVPNIQRSLVWKSIQMELLWDSILRGFPIGSMLVLENDDNTQELLDGQQRANAIITGFNINELLSSEEKPKAILWYDLAHKENDSDPERRKYGIRLTNASHPWGFDYSGYKLTASERREALRNAYGENYPSKKTDWDIRHFVPLKHDESFLPVPLAILVNAAFKVGNPFDVNSFLEIIKEDITSFSKFSEQWENIYKNSVLHFIAENKDFVKPFQQLNNYAIVFNSVTIADDIEILFNRVNSRGTQMSGAELTYAAIKHYGAKLCNCPNIGQIIKKNAKGIMMEHILAQIIFRYCFSENSIHGEINAGQIRKQALLDNSNRVSDKLSCFFSNNGENLTILLSKAKEILLSSPNPDEILPNFLLAQIANDNQNLFILLFCLIDKHNLDPKFVQALIFFLYCFSKNNEPIRLIFEIVSQKESVDIETIQDILRDSISREWCYPLVPSFENFHALQESEYVNTWNYKKYENEKGFGIFQLLFPYKTSQGLFMLKYAQRKYYNCVFGDYDPSSKEYWDEINRPWDHDHIIPQSWIQNGDWENCQKLWINSMGNIADIPFEKNRSKSDDEDFTYYENEDNSKLLFFNSEIKEISKQIFGQGQDMNKFMDITSKRFVAISSDFLALFNVLQLENNLSEMQAERKRFLLYQKEVLKDYDLYYRGNDGKEIPIENENDIYSWQRPWISLIQQGNPDQEHWRRAVAVYQGSTLFIIERGLRNMSMKSSSDSFWKDGSKYGQQTTLFENNVVSPLASILCNGAKYYNDKWELTGFIENSSLMSYKTTICDVEIIGTIYSYYGCFHCSIRSKNEKTQLPKIVLDSFDREKGFTGSHNDIYIDCYLSGKDPNMKDVCDKFAALMKELEQLNDICK